MVIPFSLLQTSCLRSKRVDFDFVTDKGRPVLLVTIEPFRI
ncbi:hypothetical protein F383_16114 [Gossypium arboreum]|uniref:Uncharacterized protein n=1 Tax=Gossypium arboreum TaxID=29729 RepID=A0A0B0PVB7_GOSAR|nr:hypothetical protein F383_16114 [Gossypium arboreum]